MVRKTHKNLLRIPNLDQRVRQWLVLRSDSLQTLLELVQEEEKQLTARLYRTKGSIGVPAREVLAETSLRLL